MSEVLSAREPAPGSQSNLPGRMQEAREISVISVAPCDNSFLNTANNDEVAKNSAPPSRRFFARSALRVLTRKPSP